MTGLLLRIVIALLSGMTLVACTPERPPTDEPPEPQVVTAHDTQLRDAIQAPLSQAKQVGDVVQDAADQRSSEIDAQSE